MNMPFARVWSIHGRVLITGPYKRLLDWHCTSMNITATALNYTGASTSDKTVADFQFVIIGCHIVYTAHAILQMDKPTAEVITLPNWCLCKRDSRQGGTTHTKRRRCCVTHHASRQNGIMGGSLFGSVGISMAILKDLCRKRAGVTYSIFLKDTLRNIHMAVLSCRVVDLKDCRLPYKSGSYSLDFQSWACDTGILFLCIFCVCNS